MLWYNKKLIEELSKEQIEAAYLYKKEENLTMDVKAYISENYKGKEKDEMLADSVFISSVVDRLSDISFLWDDISYCIEDIGISNLNPKTRLFVDMDGTLTRLYDEKNYLDRFNDKGFYLNIKPYFAAVEGINKLILEHPEIEVYILSATNGKYCEFEKNRWLNKYLPSIKIENRIFMPHTENKIEYIPNGITPYDFILDDYNLILERVENECGVGIKAINNINNKGKIGKKWEGYGVKIFENKDVCENIIAIIEEVKRSNENE